MQIIRRNAEYIADSLFKLRSRFDFENREILIWLSVFDACIYGNKVTELQYELLGHLLGFIWHH
jgi:hypothetical protein